MSSIPFLFHLPPDFPIPRGTEPTPKSSAVPSLFPLDLRVALSRARTPSVADRLRDRRRDPGTDPSPPLSFFSFFSPLLFLFFSFSHFFSFPFPLPSSLLSPTLRAWPLLPLRSRSPRPLLLLGTARPRHHPPLCAGPSTPRAPLATRTGRAPQPALPRSPSRSRPARPARAPLSPAPSSPRTPPPGSAHTGARAHARPRDPALARAAAAPPLRSHCRCTHARPNQPCALTPRHRPPLTPYRRRRPRHSGACSGHRLPGASRRLTEPDRR